MTRIETYDGLPGEYRTWALEYRTVHAYMAEAGEAVTDRAEAGDEDGAGDGPTDAEALAAVNEQVATLNARVGDWIYTVPSFKSEQFTRRMNDLLAAEE